MRNLCLLRRIIPCQGICATRSVSAVPKGVSSSTALRLSRVHYELELQRVMLKYQELPVDYQRPGPRPDG